MYNNIIIRSNTKIISSKPQISPFTIQNNNNTLEILNNNQDVCFNQSIFNNNIDNNQLDQPYILSPHLVSSSIDAMSNNVDLSIYNNLNNLNNTLLKPILNNTNNQTNTSEISKTYEKQKRNPMYCKFNGIVNTFLGDDNKNNNTKKMLHLMTLDPNTNNDTNNQNTTSKNNDYNQPNECKLPIIFGESKLIVNRNHRDVKQRCKFCRHRFNDEKRWYLCRWCRDRLTACHSNELIPIGKYRIKKN